MVRSKDYIQVTLNSTSMQIINNLADTYNTSASSVVDLMASVTGKVYAASFNGAHTVFHYPDQSKRELVLPTPVKSSRRKNGKRS